MNRLKLTFAIAATGFFMHAANAQTVNDSLKPLSSKKDKDAYYEQMRKNNKLTDLEQEKIDILSEEKYELQKEVDRIDTLLANQSITKEEADDLKAKAAKQAAMNIDNKNAIVENQMALLERGSNYNFEYSKGSFIELGLGNAYDESGSALFGIHFKNGSKVKKYDKRTYSDMLLNTGFVNTLRDGESFSNSPYKFGKSMYLELGIVFKTRLLKTSNAARLSYGLSFQFNSLETSGNKYFASNGNSTNLEVFPYRLKDSKMRFDNLLLPVHFEFGPSTKTEHKDYFRYNNNSHFKFGIGGYAGVNLNAVQRLKYDFNGEDIIQKTRQDYNVNKFLYGLSTYVGYGPFSLYFKYELNPLFKNAAIKENTIASGLRLEL